VRLKVSCAEASAAGNPSNTWEFAIDRFVRFITLATVTEHG
jgi:hypothetical protein